MKFRVGMRERDRLACIRITKELMKFPSAICFLDPPDADEGTDIPSQFPSERINCPVDLTSILTRLEQKEYESLDVWDHDLSLIWYNAEKYFGRSSYVFYLSQALHQQYEKLRRVFAFRDLTDWTREFVRLEKKVNDLMAIPPPKAKRYFPQGPSETHQPTFSEEEFAALLKAVRVLTRPSDALFFNNLIQLHAPKTSIREDSFSIDLRDLPVTALNSMRDYAIKRYADMNKTYPVAYLGTEAVKVEPKPAS
jgi:hypothetical protein